MRTLKWWESVINDQGERGGDDQDGLVSGEMVIRGPMIMTSTTDDDDDQ